MLIHHTDCGMLKFTDERVQGASSSSPPASGPSWDSGAFRRPRGQRPRLDQKVVDEPLHPQHRLGAGLRLRGRDGQAARGRLSRSAGGGRRPGPRRASAALPRPWPRPSAMSARRYSSARSSTGSGWVAHPTLADRRKPVSASSLSAAADAVQHALGQALGRLAADAGGQDGELVAAQPGDHVVAARGLAQRVGGGAQHPVAAGVAEQRVGRLEVVEVHQQQARPGRSRGRPRGRMSITASNARRLATPVSGSDSARASARSRSSTCSDLAAMISAPSTK